MVIIFTDQAMSVKRIAASQLCTENVAFNARSLHRLSIDTMLFNDSERTVNPNALMSVQIKHITDRFSSCALFIVENLTKGYKMFYPGDMIAICLMYKVYKDLYKQEGHALIVFMDR